jgi:ABC-2 type transport system permease protein
MIAVGFLNLAILWLRATNAPDWRPLITGTLALLLLGGSFIALGLLVSTFTRNQIVAGTLTFGLILGIWIIGWIDPTWFGGAWQPVVEAITYLGLMRHFEDLMKGILDLKDVVFYLSFTLFNLFLAHQSVESQRWRA